MKTAQRHPIQLSIRQRGKFSRRSRAVLRVSFKPELFVTIRIVPVKGKAPLRSEGAEDIPE